MAAYVTPTPTPLVSQIASTSSIPTLSQTPSPTSFGQEIFDAEDFAISTDISLGRKGDNGDDNHQPEPEKIISCPKAETIKKQLEKDGRIAAVISDMTQRYRVEQMKAKAAGGIIKKHMYEYLLKIYIKI